MRRWRVERLEGLQVHSAPDLESHSVAVVPYQHVVAEKGRVRRKTRQHSRGNLRHDHNEDSFWELWIEIGVPGDHSARHPLFILLAFSPNLDASFPTELGRPEHWLLQSQPFTGEAFLSPTPEIPTETAWQVVLEASNAV